MRAPLLEAEGLARCFRGGRRLFGQRRTLHAVRRVDLVVQPGESLGIVGESGCGKTTLARMLVGLDRPSAGRIRLDGTDLAALAARERARRIQYVFQDPASALNPRHRVGSGLTAPLVHLRRIERAARGVRLEALLAAVGLRTDLLDRYPHELSGGQAQRVGIARALAAEPRLVVLDEPVSALDVSIQAQVLNLLAELRQKRRLAYLFISHDLAVVEAVSDRIAVMYGGLIVEMAAGRDLFRRPRHPYTQLLIEAAPEPGRHGLPVGEDCAEVPDPFDPPVACAFAPRCPRASDRCRQAPPLVATGDGGEVACHHPLP